MPPFLFAPTVKTFRCDHYLTVYKMTVYLQAVCQDSISPTLPLLILFVWRKERQDRTWQDRFERFSGAKGIIRLLLCHRNLYVNVCDWLMILIMLYHVYMCGCQSVGSFHSTSFYPLIIIRHYSVLECEILPLAWEWAESQIKKKKKSADIFSSNLNLLDIWLTTEVCVSL